MLLHMSCCSHATCSVHILTFTLTRKQTRISSPRQGDHAYNEGDDSERRADGYMQGCVLEPCHLCLYFVCVGGGGYTHTHTQPHRHHPSTNRDGDRYQPVLSRCPWFPTVGNHEYYSGEELARYLDSTWEKWNSSIPQSQSDESKKGVSSTATSTLGKMISMANVHGAGLHGSTPSNTSR
jgi:hypothetical protein